MRDIVSNTSLHQQEQILREAIRDGINQVDPELFVLPHKQLGHISVTCDDWEYVTYGTASLKSVASQFVDYSEARLNPQGSVTLVQKSCISHDLANSYMESKRWDGVPVMKRAMPAPVIGPDLTIRWDQGWDPESRVYVTESMEPVLDIVPSEGSARDAARYLLRWFAPFAFKYDESQADCLAMALTPYLMFFNPDATIPGGLFSATQQGSGKTELARLVSVMGSGRAVRPTVWSHQGEMRKQVTSHLLESPPVVLIDNIKASLDSEVVESLLTSRESSDRGFHTQKNIKLRNDTLWLFTQNAPEASKDMLRRLIIVPLDKDEWRGTWDPEIVTKAQRERQKIVTAMITLIKAWDEVGRPSGSVAISGYEMWSRVVSGILEHAGVTGFYQHREEIEGTTIDTGENDEAVMLERIGKIMGPLGRSWQAKELWDKVNDPVGHFELYNSPDAIAVRKWLDSTPAKNKVMATGGRLRTLVNKWIKGCDWKLVYKDKFYTLVWTSEGANRPPTF